MKNNIRVREVSHIQEIGDAGEVQGDAGDAKLSINRRLRYGCSCVCSCFLSHPQSYDVAVCVFVCVRVSSLIVTEEICLEISRLLERCRISNFLDM
jgi:hypothetical protein